MLIFKAIKMSIVFFIVSKISKKIQLLFIFIQ